MTKLLEKAFEVATKLPPEQQDALAALVLDEISSEKRWDEAFAKSQDVLAALARLTAKTPRRQGKAKNISRRWTPMDADKTRSN